MDFFELLLAFHGWDCYAFIMSLELAPDFDLTACSVWGELEPGSPQFEDAFWAAVTPTGLPSAPPAGIVVLGLAAALLAKRFDLVALAARLAAKASEAVLRDCLDLTDELCSLLVAAGRQLRQPPSDPVRSSRRVAAVLSPRFAHPDPALT
ncbi:MULTISPECIES: hypothetical protein [Thiomonas]|jgi:hypothetical protein|uniref:hypothetical protein n=2 Tax=Burkholderiales genera incertae sedis TaxID=224471 RepID=UPI0023F10B53|nr:MULTISPECIES: hypothetical protein [Thiomonas]HML80607.1 hypothetical protein [Thiomonas arsenitoxydans]